METSAQLQEEIQELKRQKLYKLQQLENYQAANKLEFFNTAVLPANPPQAKLLRAWVNQSYKIFTFTGGNRSGKTTIATIIAFSSMFGEWPWDHAFLNEVPFKVLIIGQRWEEHIKKTLVPKLEEWWPANRELQTSKNSLGIKSEWIDVKTGSVLHIMSNRQDSDAFESADYDLIIPDEPPTEKVHEAATRGLIDRGGRQLFTATLLKEPWVNQKIIKALNPDGTPDRTVYNVHAEMDDNIGYGLTQKNVDAYKWRYRNNPELLSARVKGVPSYLSGLVLGMFSRETHLKPRLKDKNGKYRIPLHWIVDISIDVHPRENQAVLFIATAPSGNRYIVDEIWMACNPTELGQEIMRYVLRNSYRVGRIIIDPLSVGDTNSPEGTIFDKIDKVLKAYEDMPTLEVASKDKTAGILNIKEHLEGITGEPSLWFTEDLVRTIFEIEGWMYDKDTQKPQDKDDHMMENLYRLLNLETEWYALDDEDEDEEDASPQGGSSVTGY